ncbi:MAG: c-type cytochrome [Janthinobacterium lividum]
MTLPSKTLPLLCLAFAGASGVGTYLSAQHAGMPAGADLPRWAYPVLPASPVPSASGATPARAQPSVVEHVPGSKAEYTSKEIPVLQVVPDWFPDEHPPMPPVVAHGRLPNLGACAHCHLPTGMGRPENQSIAGLSPEYMMQQVEDFRSGARKSSEPRMASVNNMILASKTATPEEMKSAIAYFASLQPRRWIRVVETDTVPLTKIGSLMLVVTDAAKSEPIGNRVIEVSEDQEQTELRNPKSGFVAYVPKGSLQIGESLVRTGGEGRTIACTECHGVNLRGVGSIPSIAGRSPSQMTRQLMDFQTGARNGSGAVVMRGPVAKLTVADMVAITGYLASLEP